MSDAVRIAVIGAGLVGARHACHVWENTATKLAWIVDPDPATKELAASFGADWAPSVDAVPAETCDAAIIATPNANHLPTGLTCAQRSWPCLIEKPIADSLTNGRELIDAFERAGLPLLVGHHRRYHPFVQTARDLLASGEIGRPVFVSAVWAVRKPDSYFSAGQWRRTSSGGPLLINFIHEADLLLTFFGPVTHVQAMTANDIREGAVEDTAAINLRFRSGVLGSIALTDASLSPWSFEGASGENPTIAETGVSSWRIGCTRGSFDFPGLTVYKDAENDIGDWSRPLRSKSHARESKPPLAEQLSHFAELVRGDVARPEVTGEDGLAALTLVDAVLKAAQSGTPITTIDTVSRDYVA